MIRSTLAGLVLLTLAGCGPGTFLPIELADGGHKVQELVRMLAAQRVDQVAAGNHILGTAAPLGKTGATSLQLRVTGVSRRTPRLEGVPISTDGPQSGTFPTESGTATSVSVDGAVGLWPGFRVGAGHLLGIDLLGGVSLLSGHPASDLKASGGRVAVAGGFRLGIVEETASNPGISLSVVHQRLPSLSISPDPLATDDGEIAVVAKDIGVRATSARIAMSKQWRQWGATIGYGSDDVTLDGTTRYDLTGRTLGADATAIVSQEAEVRRTLLFGGISYRLGRVTLAGEVGRRSGGNDPEETYNGFEGGWGRSYLAIGLRVGP